MLILPVQPRQIVLGLGQAVAGIQLREQDCALPILAHESAHQVAAVAPQAG